MDERLIVAEIADLIAPKLVVNLGRDLFNFGLICFGFFLAKKMKGVNTRIMCANGSYPTLLGLTSERRERNINQNIL